MPRDAHGFVLVLGAALLASTPVAGAETGMGLVVDQEAKVAYRVDLEQGEIVYTTPAFGTDVANGRFSPDGERLAYVTGGSQVFVCDLDGAVQRSFAVFQSGTLSWTASGIWVGGDGRAVLYDVSSGGQLDEFTPDWSPASEIKIRTISHNEEVAGALKYPSPVAKAVMMDGSYAVVNLGDGCSVGPNRDGTLLTHNLWETGLEHQTMKVHSRDGTQTHYFYLFDIIPYPADETDGWSWNSQLFASNSNDIMLVPTGRGFPQMTDSRMPWIYNLATGEANCLHTDCYAWGLFLHPNDFYAGRTGPRPGQVEIERFAAAPPTIEEGQDATLSWSVVHADQVTLDGEAVEASGTTTVTPASTTTYTLAAQGDGGPVSAQVTVTVVAQPVPNEAPTVDVGPDVSVMLDTAYRLDATAADDGLPDGTLTLLWTQEAGPGTVTFDDATAEDVYVTFDAIGDYTLRLTASDGELSAQAELTVHVLAAEEPVINVLAPRAGDVLYVGDTAYIEWETFNLADVVISYSTDDAATWTPLAPSLDQSSPHWGSYPWTVPDEPTAQAWIWMEGYFGEATTHVGPFEIAVRPEPEPGETESGEALVYTLGRGLSCSASGAASAAAWWPALLLLLGWRRTRR